MFYKSDKTGSMVQRVRRTVFKVYKNYNCKEWVESTFDELLREMAI